MRKPHKSLDDIDPFGVLDIPLEAPTYLTEGQYTQIVCDLGQRLGMEAVEHYFNLPGTESISCEERVTGTGSSTLTAESIPITEQHTPREAKGGKAGCSFSRPTPLCVHFLREGALDAMRNPNSLPSVARKKGEESPEGPPHVHCFFCLKNGGTGEGDSDLDPGQPYVQVEDLRRRVHSHFTEHMNKRNAYLSLLEGEGVVLDDVQQQLLESCAEREGRHTCFVVSAGETSHPIIAVYCAACEQMAPLATFTKEDEKDTASSSLSDHRQEHGVRVSEETVELILSRLLLACEVWVRLQAEQNGENSEGHIPLYEESYIFIPTPYLFGEEEDELSETFEDGAVLTHSSAVLPAAAVVEVEGETRLCLLSQEGEELLEKLSDLPPYHISHAVVGFVMMWPSVAATDEKVAWALQQAKVKGKKLEVQRWPVYVEDTDEWIVARVLHHPEILPPNSEGSLNTVSSFGEVRTREQFSITKMMPLSLAKQFVQRRGVASEGTKIEREVTEVAADAELQDCPYGMEARTINYFTQMTALAKAMCLAAPYM